MRQEAAGGRAARRRGGGGGWRFLLSAGKFLPVSGQHCWAGGSVSDRGFHFRHRLAGRTPLSFQVRAGQLPLSMGKLHLDTGRRPSLFTGLRATCRPAGSGSVRPSAGDAPHALSDPRSLCLSPATRSPPRSARASVTCPALPSRCSDVLPPTCPPKHFLRGVVARTAAPFGQMSPPPCWSPLFHDKAGGRGAAGLPLPGASEPLAGRAHW